MQSATLRNGPVDASLVNSPEAMRSSNVIFSDVVLLLSLLLFDDDDDDDDVLFVVT
tara:strand:+ start:3933 stop:4100 length:168 start_codon:yes stop_codon:yes gene_type:complete